MVGFCHCGNMLGNHDGDDDDDDDDKGEEEDNCDDGIHLNHF